MLSNFLWRGSICLLISSVRPGLILDLRVSPDLTTNPFSKTGSIAIAKPPSTPVSYIVAELLDEKFILSLTFRVTTILV